MEHDPLQSAQQPPEPLPGAPSKAASQSRTTPRRGFAFQFGIVELFGLFISFAIWYFAIVQLSRGEHAPTPRNYGPPLPQRPPSRADRYVATVCSTLLSIGGSYLACRVATTKGITSVSGRLLLQACFVFVIVPVLLFAASFCLLIPFL
jgi:hypothetical protein